MSTAATIHVIDSDHSEDSRSAPTIPRLWSVKALADRLCVSRALIYKLHNSGKLRGVRILTGDDERRCPLRFAEDDVLRLIRPEERHGQVVATLAGGRCRRKGAV